MTCYSCEGMFEEEQDGLLENSPPTTDLDKPIMNSTPDPKGPPLKAGLARNVVVELVLPGETERLEFDIVPNEYADFASGFLGAGTPLAQAVEGLAAGSSAPYTNGDCLLVRVLQVERSTTPPPKYIAERREQKLRQALDQVDRTSAMIFASSFSGKWGDYDPTGFIDEPVEQEDEVEGLS